MRAHLVLISSVESFEARCPLLPGDISPLFYRRPPSDERWHEPELEELLPPPPPPEPVPPAPPEPVPLYSETVTLSTDMEHLLSRCSLPDSTLQLSIVSTAGTFPSHKLCEVVREAQARGIYLSTNCLVGVMLVAIAKVNRH